MPRPFRLTGPSSPVNLGRLPNGRFVQSPLPPPPAEIEARAHAGTPPEQTIEQSPRARCSDESLPWGSIELPPKPFRVI